MGDPMRNFVNKVPIIGPWVGQVGQVLDIVGSPCEPEPWLMVLAVWHALPRVVWTLLKPDVLDSTQERFGSPHKKRKKRKFIIDELNEPTNKIKLNKLGWALFDIAGAVQKVGWYMSIIDATLDGVVLWSSTVYQYSGCKAPGQAYARQHLGSALVGDTHGAWTTITVWNLDYEHTFSASPSTITVPMGYQNATAINMVVQDPPFPLTPATSWSARIIDSLTGEVMTGTELSPKTAGAQTGTAVFRDWQDLHPIRQYRVEVMVNGGALYFTGSTWWCYGGKDKFLIGDP